MLHPRIARRRVRQLLAQFPAVSILGPRQIGKSTLARLAFPDFDIIDLEDAGDYRRLNDDPAFVLQQYRHLVIDEAQRMPTLFPVLRSFLDRNPRHKIVLLGSASPALVRQISESLAGRTAFLELSGVSIFEARQDDIWFRGGYPRVHWGSPRPKPAEWYPAYLRSCLEQDVPQLGFRVAATRLRDLITMIAHAQSSVLNASELGASLAMDYHSVLHIIDILEGIYLIRRLQPYQANVRKRLVKRPKIYIRDTGLLHHLLGMGFTRSRVQAHPKAGASFETLVIEQILEHAKLVDPAARGYFFRTHTGIEVDLLLELRARLIPIEIKLGVTAPDVTGLRTCMDDLGLRQGYVVNRTKTPVDIARGVRNCSLPRLLEELRLTPASPPSGAARTR